MCYSSPCDLEVLCAYIWVEVSSFGTVVLWLLNGFIMLPRSCLHKLCVLTGNDNKLTVSVVRPVFWMYCVCVSSGEVLSIGPVNCDVCLLSRDNILAVCQ